MDIQGLYNTLLTATFGGLPFGVIDTTQEVGRRMQRFFFPGIDDAQYQDLGADDGPIVIRGLLVGDDYIAQMRQFLSICRSVGPYTLVHPWLGSLQVVFVPQTRPKVSLAATEIRVCRFEMQVLNYAPQPGSGLDTLSQLEVSCDELKAQVQNYLANALAPIATASGALAYAQSFLSGAAQTFDAAVTSFSAGGILSAAAAGPILAMGETIAGVASSWAGNTATAMIDVPAAIAAAAAPPVPAAVAPGGALTAAAAADPAITASALLAAAAGFVVPAGAPAPGPAMGAAMQAICAGYAVQAAAGIDYTSQQQAEAQAALLYAALDAAAVAMAVQAQSDPVNAAPVWRELLALKAALAADVNSLVGRLPPVVTITTETTVSAWTLAQYISGDTPSEVFATYLDIISRNNVLNPALVPPGKLEVLDV